jgi:hypothetical protein
VTNVHRISHLVTLDETLVTANALCPVGEKVLGGGYTIDENQLTAGGSRGRSGEVPHPPALGRLGDAH